MIFFLSRVMQGSRATFSADCHNNDLLRIWFWSFSDSPWVCEREERDSGSMVNRLLTPLQLKSRVDCSAPNFQIVLGFARLAGFSAQHCTAIRELEWKVLLSAGAADC